MRELSNYYKKKKKTVAFINTFYSVLYYYFFPVPILNVWLGTSCAYGYASVKIIVLVKHCVKIRYKM